MIRPTYPDPLLARTWLAAASASELGPEQVISVTVLEQSIALWRDAAGAAHAVIDRCPHRGARLSRGKVVGSALQCPYHGWRFDRVARCVAWPAHPNDTPGREADALGIHVSERYGLVWIALESPGGDPPGFPAHDEPGRVAHIDGPYDYRACAPRVIENFLDMAHFPFVHPGTLGLEPHTEVKDYEVIATEAGIRSRGCRFWQPQPSGVASDGAEADYEYRVTHPLVASLAKLPGRPDAFDILMVTSPIDETTTRIWKINVFAGGAPADRFAAYSRAAMLQDQATVESQSPKKMPLDPRSEFSLRSDRLSVAYRRWLRGIGLTYGVTP